MAVIWLHKVIGFLFFACYVYQFFYLAVPFFKKAAPHKPAKPHRFAVLIAARNEEAVIGQLLDSIAAQDYTQAPVTVFVAADNCTDDTAAVARARGAVVYERFNRQQVGKGYALSWLLSQMRRDFAPDAFDAYLVLDADNVLEPDYIRHMNQSLSDGFSVVTGYRNSKNYGDNWISSGYALWFLRESQQLNRARARLGLSCMVSGTGFAFTRAVMERQGGWPYHTLTEDCEFTANQMIAGECIGYCEQAVLYDEQPVRFSQSWRQRLRWSKGYFQVLQLRGGALLRGVFRGSFSCYDMLASIFPAFFLSAVLMAVDTGSAIARCVAGASLLPVLFSLLSTMAGVYGTFLFLGSVTLITEWRRIRLPWYKKSGYLLLFPLFMLTYIPVAITALFCPVKWKPVEHRRTMSLEEIRADR